MKARQLYEWGRRYITVPLLGVVCFAIYVCFLKEDDSVVTRMEYQNQINDLNAEIDANLDSLELYNRLNASLETDRDNIERVVRERYHMKRPNEDIYVFETTKK